ncbi:MAG: sensor histidine kinase [Ruminococcaceae bacterium]|nr:sensor histidine kinase [Oscillospiraceae bacterium]
MNPEENRLSALFPDVAAQLRAALSNLHMVAQQLVPEERREQDPLLDAKAALLDQSYYQMLRLVNGLSASACLTSEEPFALQDRDLVELVGTICERAGDLAPLLGLELRFVCAPERLICAVAPDMLEQLLYHLLSNAFKFTPAGGTVTVELQVKGKQVQLAVEDTGRGISEDRLEALFDRYLQAGQRDPAPHGLGLGLALCRRIAEGHGGALMASSKEGKGSRFVLALPNRQLGGNVSDVSFDYAGGFNRTLLGLADALPPKAFLVRYQD